MHSSLARQAGHAAMLFAMMIPAFFALFILASDGARALQSKARLEDASEVAVLAIAAHNSDSDAINQQIAREYISQYMTDMTLLKEIQVVKKNCAEIDECLDDIKEGKSRFFQYQIQSKSDHLSWFPNDNGVAGFGEKFTVAGSATARKYQSEAVDVLFVTDFSGSMLCPLDWTGNQSHCAWYDFPNAKYKVLKTVISEVTAELQKFNELGNGETNRVGNVSFSKVTRNQDSHCSVSQLLWTGDENSYSYRHHDEYGWGWHRLSWNKWRWHYRTDVDYQNTIASIFTEKSNLSDEDCSGKYHDIVLTEDFSSFNNTIKQFYPDGYTSSYEGIIRGAQLLITGENSRRLLIVLSDGDDLPAESKTISKQLVDSGMCSKILTKLNEGTADGKEIRARLAVIGFDYDVQANRALKDCVGADNVFRAQDKNEIINKILELISEEIGHLKE